MFTPTITATYSIVATDATTRQVGGAGATCLESRDVYETLYLSSPNRIVLHTQGLLIDHDDPIITTALDMMQIGTSVDAMLEEMQRLDNNNFTIKNGELELEFREVEVRQYGISMVLLISIHRQDTLGKVSLNYGHCTDMEVPR